MESASLIFLLATFPNSVAAADYLLTTLLLSQFKVVDRLQIKPALGIAAKIAGEAKCRINIGYSVSVMRVGIG